MCLMKNLLPLCQTLISVLRLVYVHGALQQSVRTSSVCHLHLVPGRGVTFSGIITLLLSTIQFKPRINVMLIWIWWGTFQLRLQSYQFFPLIKSLILNPFILLLSTFLSSNQEPIYSLILNQTSSSSILESTLESWKPYSLVSILIIVLSFNSHLDACRRTVGTRPVGRNGDETITFRSIFIVTISPSPLSKF